jgi:hypothetical protein
MEDPVRDDFSPEHPHSALKHATGGIGPSFAFPTSLPKGEDCETQLLNLGIELHLLSRPPGRLPPTYKWPASCHAAWGRGMKLYGPVLTKALDDWDIEETDTHGLGLLNTFIGFLGIPTIVLIPPMHACRAPTGDVLVKLPGGDQ